MIDLRKNKCVLETLIFVIMFQLYNICVLHSEESGVQYHGNLQISGEYKSISYQSDIVNPLTSYQSLNNPMIGRLNMFSELEYGKDISISGKVLFQENFSSNRQYTIGILPENPTFTDRLYNPLNQVTIDAHYKYLALSLGSQTPYFSDLTMGSVGMFGIGGKLDFGFIRLKVVTGISQAGVDSFSYNVAQKYYKVNGAYKRKLTGINLGFGNIRSTFVDLNLVKLVDDPTSSKPDSLVKAKDGINISINTRIEFSKNVAFTFEGASSIFTSDISKESFPLKGEPFDTTNTVLKEFDKWYQKESKIVKNSIKTLDFLLDNGLKISTKADIAFKMGLDLSFKKWSIGMRAKYLGPGYEPLGYYSYISKDYLEISLLPKLYMIDRKLNIYGNIGYRINNFSASKGMTTRNFTGNINVDYYHNQNFSVNLGIIQYNILSDMMRIPIQVTDSTYSMILSRLIDSYLSSIKLSPTYRFEIDRINHCIQISSSYDIFTNYVSNVASGNEQSIRVYNQIGYELMFPSSFEINCYISSDLVKKISNVWGFNIGMAYDFKEIGVETSINALATIGGNSQEPNNINLQFQPRFIWKIFENTSLSFNASIRIGKENVWDWGSANWFRNSFNETNFYIGFNQRLK